MSDISVLLSSCLYCRSHLFVCLLSLLFILNLSFGSFLIYFFIFLIHVFGVFAVEVFAVQVVKMRSLLLYFLFAMLCLFAKSKFLVSVIRNTLTFIYWSSLCPRDPNCLFGVLLLHHGGSQPCVSLTLSTKKYFSRLEANVTITRVTAGVSGSLSSSLNRPSVLVVSAVINLYACTPHINGVCVAYYRLGGWLGERVSE